MKSFEQLLWPKLLPCSNFSFKPITGSLEPWLSFCGFNPATRENQFTWVNVENRRHSIAGYCGLWKSQHPYGLMLAWTSIPYLRLDPEKTQLILGWLFSTSHSLPIIPLITGNPQDLIWFLRSSRGQVRPQNLTTVQQMQPRRGGEPTNKISIPDAAASVACTCYRRRRRRRRTSPEPSTRRAGDWVDDTTAVWLHCSCHLWLAEK